MAVDDAGRAYLTGGTSSGDYPGTFVGGSRGSHDVFSTTINTGAGVPPDPEPDPEPAFTLSVAPATQGIVRGDAATYTAVVTKDDPAQSVTLSIAGLPEGATATLVQSDDDSTTITVQTSESTPLGDYDLTVTGRSGNVTRTATVQLDIHCCPRPG
jgi:hypothetical protein